METQNDLNRSLTELAFHSKICNELFDEIYLRRSGRVRPLAQIQHMYEHTPQTASFTPCPILAGKIYSRFDHIIKSPLIYTVCILVLHVRLYIYIIESPPHIAFKNVLDLTAL